MGKRVFVNSCCWVIFLLVMVNTITAQQGWFKPVPTTTMKPLRAPGRATLATTTSKTTTSTTTTTTTTPTRPPPAVARRFSAVLFPSDDEWTPNSTPSDMPSEIPLELLQQLNEADNIDDFLKYVENVTIIRGADGDPPILVEAWETIDGRVGSGGERDSSVPAKPANCVPELQTVPLLSNQDPSVLFYPSCTRIERCGGCCSSELLACEPTKQETVLLQVIKTQYSGGSKMKFAGKEIVPVQKHTACKCQCKVKETDCTKNQAYVPGACRCECTNLDDRRKCETENQTRFWDGRECACRCRESAQQCSSGFYFNEDVCKCESWVSRRSESGVRAVLGEGGRKPVNFGGDKYFEETNGGFETNRRKSNVWFNKDEENEDEADKAFRPVERFQFNGFNRNRHFNQNNNPNVH